MTARWISLSRIDDAGLYRASFYHAGKRVRVVLDRDGQLQGDVELRTR